ncbi:hypothetical protein [Streptomyces sp. MZ04]|uniref:hypothetical protein n=1 Tax=Streptomyces sp. MZ04 TaxID=2559236 RepID=UPI001ADF4044|nr:hypothetical protein [Streptomyces sp. MZ04]
MTQQLAAQPMPFGGDEQRWNHAVRDTARRLHSEPVDTDLVVRERTRQGWLRWEVVADERSHLHGRLREAGVFPPVQGRGWLWLCKTVWGRQPPTYIWDFAGQELPRPIPMGRAVVFTAVTLAALGPAMAMLPAMTRLLTAGVVGAVAAAGLPAATRHATRRRVRVVGKEEVHAPVFFRILTGAQQLHVLALRSERPELARAVAMLPGLLWDAAGLVALAEDNAEARQHLLGYEEALTLLLEQGIEVERQEEAVESAIREQPALLAPGADAAALPDQLMPRSVLDEARRELEELGHGLRHARGVLRGASNNETGDSTRKGDGHAR